LQAKARVGEELVNGKAVYDASGEKIGNVYDIMIDKASGKADYAILNFGSFLGMGGRYHPLPWNQPPTTRAPVASSSISTRAG
jgi:sporulation protein YlmC with PRC-barrel domain